MRLTLTLIAASVVACGACATPKRASNSLSTVEPEAVPDRRPDSVSSGDATSRATTETPIADAFRGDVEHIISTVMNEGLAYDRLRHLCDVIGPRLSGSKGLENAVEWTAATMEADGLDRVVKQPVMVPAWVRGEESLTLLTPRSAELHMLGIGNSVGTDSGPITAEVVVAADFDELAALGARAKGKIVLFDHPMPEYDPEKGAGYGQTVIYRSVGASRAAEYGAVACLVRSVTARSLRSPHTGMLRYEADKPQIPAAAVSTEDAAMIARLVDAGETVTVRLSMDAHFEEDAPSANVIGDIIGWEKPDEIVLISGHLDSWDVGTGAHDDGGPTMAVMDAMRVLKALGKQPRRTIRAVLWTNEENGLRGSRTYINELGSEIGNYAVAIEADSGAFRPLGFGAPKVVDERTGRIRSRLEDMMTLFEPLGADRLRDGGGGADIGAMRAFGVPLLGLSVEGSKYFDYHHTHADTFDKVSKDDILRCEAVMAATAWVLANMDDKLGD